MSIYTISSSTMGDIDPDNMTLVQWTALQRAANFQGVSGRRGDTVVSDEHGTLYILDTCGETHEIDYRLFVGKAKS